MLILDILYKFAYFCRECKHSGVELWFEDFFIYIINAFPFAFDKICNLTYQLDRFKIHHVTILDSKPYCFLHLDAEKHSFDSVLLIMVFF